LKGRYIQKKAKQNRTKMDCMNREREREREKSRNINREEKNLKPVLESDLV
jgi:hypothetical protein